MIFVNHALTLENLNNEVLKSFLIILNPFAPHISEEIFETLGFNEYGPITKNEWPKYDEKLLVADEITVAVQVNGKTRGTIKCIFNSDENTVFKKAFEKDSISKHLLNKDVKRKIYIPNKLINILTS